MESMHILMAAGVPRRREGGVAAIIYNLGGELEARGHRVTYMFSEDLMSGRELTDRFRETRFAWRLARHIRRNPREYSVVNLHAPYGFIYGILRKLSNPAKYPPYVMTLHGLEDRRIHAMEREDAKGQAWHFSWKNRVWHRLYHLPRYYFSIRTAGRAHSYSREVWLTLQLKYNMETSHVAYISNGVSERFFAAREYPDRKPLRFLYAGTWLDQRGIFYLREALPALNSSFRDWTFTFAGPGIAESEIKSFFGPSLAQQLHVIPVIAADKMPEVFAEHDVFVFPSLVEGLPGVLLEAMASGMPVITAETCGMVDAVEDDFNGLLVPPADAEAITAALLRVSRCAALRQRLGTAAQETMRRRTWQKAAIRLEQLFVAALSDGSNPK
jgi:glycosyltransferase involved in cell wall biosynthesis